MYFLWIVGICRLETYPLRWIIVVCFYFMHLAFSLRTALILCFTMVNAKEASIPLWKENPVLAYNVLAPSAYLLLRHFY